MPILDEALKTDAKRWLRTRADALNAIRFGQELRTEFTLEQIQTGAPRTGIAAWLSRGAWPYPNGQPSIYVITASDAATATAIVQAFPPKERRDFAGTRLNSEHNGSLTLYVGSSEKPRQRLKQHLWQAYTRITACTKAL